MNSIVPSVVDTPLRIDQLRIRQLRFVCLLADAGSLAATAEQLHMTPSAAGMLLRDIETLFGTKLFERQGRGMAPTAAARALLPRCRTLLGEAGALAQMARAGPATRLLRVGAFPHTTGGVLPRIMDALLRAPQGWQVVLHDGAADRLFGLLTQGALDVVVGRVPQDQITSPFMDQIGQHPLYEESLCVVASARHALARRRKISLEELAQHEWILPGLQSTTRQSFVDAFVRRGLTPPAPRVESPSFFYSLALVARTGLLTCCAQSAALQTAHSTAVLPVDLGARAYPVGLIWRKDAHEAVAAVDCLKAALA